MNTAPSHNSENEFKVLYDISRAMQTTLELDQILYIILTGVTSHSGLGYNRALLFLLNEEKQCLECRMAIGPKSGEQANLIWQYIEAEDIHLDDLVEAAQSKKATDSDTLFDEFKNLRFELNDETCLLTQAYHRAEPWRLTPEDITHYKDDLLLRSFKTDELIIMPLKSKDLVNGLIVADNIYTKKPISQHDIKFFTMLANQAGLAIENSRLFEIVVHQSQTDTLTGLWNHGYFQKTLTKEIAAARRQDKNICLLFFDIDNFKQLNDTCGHQHGDLILKLIAKILKESARAQDWICRYGGEEFASILTNTDQDQGLEIAERLRQRIEQFDFPSPSGMGHLHFTVSIGLASFPTDALGKDTLIAKADQSMYRAKTTGKNKTCRS